MTSTPNHADAPGTPDPDGVPATGDTATYPTDIGSATSSASGKPVDLAGVSDDAASPADRSTAGQADGSAPPPAGSGTRLTFNAPLSAERALRLATDLAATNPSLVVDLGCGWAELLLMTLAGAREAHGVGVDTHVPDLARARATAAARGLAGRVDLVDGAAADHTEVADVVLNIGAFHAFGSIPEALTALRARVRDGGRLLFGVEYWEHPPTSTELANLWEGTTVDDCPSLADLVDQAVAAGFRPIRTETVTRGEWEEYESGHMADRELWLAANPDHPDAEAVRHSLDEQRSIWLRGHRDVLGFAYLTLVAVRVP
ncbi:methyltransferase domain-containing protein [Occultella glacieicola]|uniref:Methyltransferase domain-containing protein n=1 Tax=Occultella glacieicola TaxID=2518684 RepID=A0ABY2DZD4_9MICO|nr:class I SAM-dependent methyltransferase [Occultella glacieicola]TDE89255.1 methyltransferase domain-containing protein [Occultella glacieicola]